MARTKVAVTYRLRPELLQRVKRLARDRHWTDTTAVELLLDRALTHEGYPAGADRTDDSPEP